MMIIRGSKRIQRRYYEINKKETVILEEKNIFALETETKDSALQDIT